MASMNIPGKYEFLDHPAEIKFRAFGITLADCFAHAGGALVQILTDPQTLQEIEERTFTVQAKTLTTLLYDFLSEVLVLIDAECFIPASFTVTIDRATPQSVYVLNATVFGQHTRDVVFDTEVKSITYHQMSVTNDESGYTVTVVVDV